MRGFQIFGVAAAFGIICWVSSAKAQSNYSGGTTSQGLFGSNTVGGGTATNTGRSTGGGSGGGGGATSAQNPFDQQNIGASGVARPQIETTQQRGAFVGADTGDSTNARSLQSAQTRSGQANFAQLGNLFAQGMQSVNQNNNTQGRNQPNIRIALRLGFRPAPVSPVAAVAIQSRIVKLPGIRFTGPAQVTMEGRTAVLRGTVASEEDRDLAAALAKMEPDVLDVQNELVVDSSATGEELPPAAATPPAALPPASATNRP